MSFQESKDWLRISLVVSVILHFVVSLWHGSAHLYIPVPLSISKIVFVSVVILLLPLIGASLLWTSRKRTAAWLITISMLASLLFGLINHFMRISPDYVLEVPAHAWRHSFILSAALLVLTETLGTILGAIATQSWRRID